MLKKLIDDLEMIDEPIEAASPLPQAMNKQAFLKKQRIQKIADVVQYNEINPLYVEEKLKRGPKTKPKTKA